MVAYHLELRTEAKSLHVYVSLEDFVEALLLWGDGKVFIAWLCGMRSLKAEPCVYMFVCLFIFAYVFLWVYVQPCKHLYFDMGGGKGSFPIKI